MVKRNLERRDDGGRQSGRSLSHLVLGCILGITLLSATGSRFAGAATYYLDARKGNDNAGGTSQKPWKTLEKAQDVARPGDTVILRNGDYGGFGPDGRRFPRFTGDPDQPLPSTQKWITYKAEQGHDDVRFSIIWIKIGHTPRVVAHAFDGIKVNNTNGRCVYAWGAVGLRFRNMTIVGCLDPGGLRSATSACNAVEFFKRNHDVTIDNCRIRGGYRGVSVGGGSNIRISNCDIYDTGVDKLFLAGGRDFTIENNDLHGQPLVPEDHPDCIQFYTAADRYGNVARATNVTIRGNRMYDHSSQGVWTGGSYLENVVFENNLMYNLGNYEWRVYSVHGGLIRNNTIVGDRSRNTGIIVYGAPHNSDITIVNNIFACPYWGTPSVMSYHDHNIFYDWDGSPGNSEPHSQAYDSIEAAVAAVFANPAAEDYRLAPDGAAVNFGSARWNPGVDIDGTTRDSAPDAGCFELSSGRIEEPPEEPGDEPPQDPVDGGPTPEEPLEPEAPPEPEEPEPPEEPATPEEPPTPEPPADKPPAVAVAGPGEGDTVAGTVKVLIGASDQEDAAGTLRVQAGLSEPGATHVDDWWPAAYNDASGYYEWTWDTTGWPDGVEFAVQARATDSAADPHTSYAAEVVVLVQNVKPVASSIHVASVNAFIIDGGSLAKGGAEVAVENNLGQPVEQVYLIGTFGGDISQTLLGLTDEAGVARFETKDGVPNLDRLTFEVQKVIHSDYAYNAADNEAVSDSAP
jgi:hypothetical protein